MALKMRGLIPGGHVHSTWRTITESRPPACWKRLKNGRIEVLITWEPAIGAFLRDYPGFDVVMVPNKRALGPPEQYSFPMSMGVRANDDSLKKRLDDVIEKHQAELTSILTENGVMLFGSQQKDRQP